MRFPLVDVLRVTALALGCAAILWYPSDRAVRVEVGGFENGLLAPEWGRVERENVDSPNTTDDQLSFYRRAAPPNSSVRLPIVVRGRTRIVLRATATVRSEVGVFVDGQSAGKFLLMRGPWSPHAIEIPAAQNRGRPLEISLAMRPLPLVRGAHVEHPQILVDYIEVTAEGGWRLSPGSIFAMVLGVLAVLFVGRFVGLTPGVALAASTVFAMAVLALARVAPTQATVALPRLLPVALLAGIVARALMSGVVFLTSGMRAAIAMLVVVGTTAHGSVVFFPNHSPPDIDIHVRRTLDWRDVPFEYEAMLRYGSQLPTASQDRGAASAALGEQTLIPYSPLPYFFYYAASRIGLDLYWAMTALGAALAMLAVVPLWLAGARAFGAFAAGLAAILYSLDLAVWHHLGRSHTPAVFGGALGTAALMYLLARAPDIVNVRAVMMAGCALGVAVLGYSSLVVLIGFFGLMLMGFLFVGRKHGGQVDELSRAARQGLALALVVGGVLAGALFYFHYLPGMLGGASGVEAEPDAFPGRTFFIFHNESRQSLRLWVLGLWIPLLAGLVAAPVALWRAPRWARPILVSWVLAWVLVMIFKEPALFPKLLRWAKEDQFLSPLVCLFVGAAVSAIPGHRVRLGIAAVVIAVAAWLQCRDFAHHANSLLL